MSRVVVVGAGISGLTIAYRLQARVPQSEVLVLEQAEHAGGAMWTRRRDGFVVETGPNGFLDTKTVTLELCAELGLKDRLIQASESASKNRFLFLDGRLRLMPGGFAKFLWTDLLSWRGKLSFLAERFRRKLEDPGDESIASFARRRVGQEVADVFADALVTGIYAGDPELLSLPACFPHLAQLEREYGSILKGLAKTAHQRRKAARQRGEVYRRPGTMWSLRDGLRLLVESLRERLQTPPQFGVSIHRLEENGRAVPREGPDDAHHPAPHGARLAIQNPRWLVRADGKDSWTADAVVLACPAYQQAGLLGDLDPELADRISQVPYNRVAVVALGYRKQDVPVSLDGFGFIAPQRTRRDVLGVQWSSSIFPGRAPEGAVLLQAICGGWNRAGHRRLGRRTLEPGHPRRNGPGDEHHGRADLSGNHPLGSGHSPISRGPSQSADLAGTS